MHDTTWGPYLTVDGALEAVADEMRRPESKITTGGRVLTWPRGDHWLDIAAERQRGRTS